MHIVACIKQVPDSAQIRVHPVTNTIMRQGVPTIINPYDLFSLEQALQLRDRFGGSVTVVTMGPQSATDALRKALSFGADRAILLTDRRFAGADTLATSFVLASAIEAISKDSPVDMVFCGKQTIDGDTAQVGPGIAKRLGIEQLTYVAKIREVLDGERAIIAERRSEGGVQVLKTKLPCMVAMLEGTDPIRFGSMQDAFRAARADIEIWDADRAGIEDVMQCGLRGSPTKVKKVFAPQPAADPADMVEVEGKSADDIVADALSKAFAAHPKLEADMAELARGMGA